MCPLLIINDFELLSSTLYGANAHFIHHPSSVKITQLAISWKIVNQNTSSKSKICILYLSANLWLKIQNSISVEIHELFGYLDNWHLIAQ